MFSVFLKVDFSDRLIQGEANKRSILHYQMLERKGVRLAFMDKSMRRYYFLKMAGRTPRTDAEYVSHVLNRAVERTTMFDKSGDYADLEMVLCQAWERSAMARPIKIAT